MSGASKDLSRSAIRRPLAVFRHRAFLIFWLGACVSNMGNWTENAAQSWAVTSQTIGNLHQGLYVEFLQFADFCPVLLLALIAGVISDPTSCVSRLTTEWRTSTQYMMPIVGFPSIVPVHRTRAAGKRASDA